MKKWFIISLYLVAAFVLLIYSKDVSAWIQSEETSWWHTTAISLTAFAIALVPAIPYTPVAVLFGAKYGPVTGSFINVGIALSAAMVLFFIVRYVWSPEERRRAAEMKGMDRFTAMFERNAFMAVVFARLLPFVPAQAVNIYAALTRMHWRPYMISSFLGKVPYFFTVTMLGDRLMTESWRTGLLLAAGIYTVFMLVVWLVYRRVVPKGGVWDTGGYRKEIDQ
jgi:uncharacterized membrane protein YdjX (TVP38/TMEM64 family)